MRQAIGGSWLMGLMVLFILLFSGYIVLTLDYNKTVTVKNEAVTLIEKYDGLNEESLTLLNNYLSGAGYMTMGQCGGDNNTIIYGSMDLSKPELEQTEAGQKYYYCIKKYKGANTSYYYQLTLFYRFSLPVLGDFSRFSIKGSTTSFQPKDDILYAQTVDGATGGVSDNNNNNNGQMIYTVRFNVNGGTTTIANQQVISGYRASKPSDPVRAGYTFNGWKLGDGQFDFSTPITSNMTLVADWIAR